MKKYGLMETVVGGYEAYVYCLAIKAEDGEIMYSTDIYPLLDSFDKISAEYDDSLSKATNLEEARDYVKLATGKKTPKLRTIADKASIFAPFANNQEYIDKVNKDLLYIFGAPDLGVINKPSNLNLGIIKPG